MNVPVRRVRSQLFRRTLLAALIGATVMLPACGSPEAVRATPTSTSTTALPASTTTILPIVAAPISAASYENVNAYLQSRTLRLDQMPSGWSVYNNSLSVLDNVQQERSAGCGSDSMLSVPPVIAPVGIVFDEDGAKLYTVSGGHAPELTEIFATYDNPALTFGTIKGNLDDCTSLTEQPNPIDSGVYTTVHGTMKRMSAPKYGQENVAYMATVGEDGTPAPQGIIMARKGNVIVQLDLSGIQSVNKALLEHLMTRAMANLPADAPGPTTSLSGSTTP
jgi:hypothetical protein